MKPFSQGLPGAGGCAIPASCAARASTQPHLELTFASDQSMGAGQMQRQPITIVSRRYNANDFSPPNSWRQR